MQNFKCSVFGQVNPNALKWRQTPPTPKSGRKAGHYKILSKLKWAEGKTWKEKRQARKGKEFWNYMQTQCLLVIDTLGIMQMTV